MKYIVVHCTATQQNATIDSIKAYWQNVLGWKNYGYHFIIESDGSVSQITRLGQIANGVKGYNRDSVHVAYIGGITKTGKAIDNRTLAQKESLLITLKMLKERYPNAKILGHRDLSPDLNKNGKIEPFEYVKMCPCFNAIDEYAMI